MKSEPGLAALLRRRLPILEWGATYSGQTLVGDLVAAAIVSMMLIPQSLAYALLVGLPPQLGLYASMAPLLLYAVFGTSRALAVGPVAVASLMTGAAAAQIADAGDAGAYRCRRRHRAADRDPDDHHGLAAAGLPGQLPEPPGGLGIHHGGRRADRGRADWPAARHQDARREPAGDPRIAAAPSRWREARDRGHRHRGGALPAVGEARPQAADGALRPWRPPGGHRREGRPGDGDRGLHRRGVDLRAGHARRGHPRRGARRPAEAGACRHSTRRCGPRSWCRRC